MAVYKELKTNTWKVYYRYTDWQGERKQTTKRGFLTKREALAWEREQLNKTKADLDMTFASFVETYTADMKSRIKENTWHTKEHILRTKILPYFGKRKINEIQAKDVIAWQNEMLNSKDKNGNPSLRAKYPEYFDLSTFKGLELYVWQMGPNSYSCGLMLGTNRNKTLEELINLQGVTIAEMRAILSTYDIDEKDIIIIPWQNPVSSYIAEYWISQKDEDPAVVEKRKQEYIDGIRQMLFGTEYSASVIDAASLDIDNDGVYEDCTMSYGPTSGLFTVVITASVDGRIKYKNTFNLAWGNVSFVEKDGVAQLVRDSEYHRLYVEENRIVIEGLDSQYEGYWGGPEWNFDLKKDL